MNWPHFCALLAARCTKPRLINGTVLVHLPPEPLTRQDIQAALAEAAEDEEEREAAEGDCDPRDTFHSDSGTGVYDEIDSYSWGEDHMLSSQLRLGLISANDIHLVFVDDDSVGEMWIVAALPSADTDVVFAFLNDFEPNDTEYGVAVFDHGQSDEDRESD